MILFDMERNRDIADARTRLESYMRMRTKRRSRIHKDSAEIALAQQRALNHPACRDCEFLEISHIKSFAGHKTSKVSCQLEGNDPINLYFEQPLGEPAECPDFSPISSQNPENQD